MQENNRTITNEELAAVAMALQKYAESLHHNETMMLTINRESKMYSPWSAKIFGLRQFPNK